MSWRDDLFNERSKQARIYNHTLSTKITPKYLRDCGLAAAAGNWPNHHRHAFGAGNRRFALPSDSGNE